MLKSVAEENDRLCAEKRNLEELLRRSVLEKDQRMQNSIELEEELKAIRTQLAIGKSFTEPLKSAPTVSDKCYTEIPSLEANRIDHIFKY